MCSSPSDKTLNGCYFSLAQPLFRSLSLSLATTKCRLLPENLLLSCSANFLLPKLPPLFYSNLMVQLCFKQVGRASLVNINSIEIWRAIPHSLMWCIWRERNARSIEGCEISVLYLKLLFFKPLFQRNVSELFSLSIFLDG